MYNHYMYPDELWHHGVMGMRWGVRRYQNYDGTRIGTGGKPVIDASKQAGEAFKNSVAGGQGGKAEGNARLAASAKSRPSAKDIAKKAVTPSVKQGKGREDISPAEDITKKVWPSLVNVFPSLEKNTIRKLSRRMRTLIRNR